MLLNGCGLFRGIDAWGKLIGEHHPQRNAVFNCPELLQGFGQFKARWRPGDKLKEKTALESVDAQMAVKTDSGDGAAHIGQGRAGEIKRITLHIKDHFDDVGITHLGFFQDRRCGGDHADLRFAAQNHGEFIDQRRGNERFIALDVDDGAMIGERACSLCNAISAARVIRGSQDSPGSERSGGLSNAFIIRGDDDVIDFTTVLAAFPDVLDERFTGDEVERLAWEAGGSPAGRYGN